MATATTTGSERQIGLVTVTAVLGRGAFGVVHRGFMTNDPCKQAVAVKQATNEHEIRREANLMSQLDHPHIMRLISSFEVPDDRHLYLVLELCEGPDLQVLLDARGALREHEAKRLFAQLASALCYLRERSVIHRDIKPANCMLVEPLIDLYSADLARAKLKLLDFGFSKCLDGVEASLHAGNNHSRSSTPSASRHGSKHGGFWGGGGSRHGGGDTGASGHGGSRHGSSRHGGGSRHGDTKLGTHAAYLVVDVDAVNGAPAPSDAAQLNADPVPASPKPSGLLSLRRASSSFSDQVLTKISHALSPSTTTTTTTAATKLETSPGLSSRVPRIAPPAILPPASPLPSHGGEQASPPPPAKRTPSPPAKRTSSSSSAPAYPRGGHSMTPEPPRLFVSLGSGGANSGGGAANGENFSVHKVSPKGTRLFADPGLAAPGRFVGRASAGRPGPAEDGRLPMTRAEALELDCYSLGVLLRYMLTGCPPHMTMMEAISAEQSAACFGCLFAPLTPKARRRRPRRLVEPRELSDEARDILQRFAKRPDARFTVADAKAHDWIEEESVHAAARAGAGGSSSTTAGGAGAPSSWLSLEGSVKLEDVPEGSFSQAGSPSLTASPASAAPPVVLSVSVIGGGGRD